jgi:hypothetical protein
MRGEELLQAGEWRADGCKGIYCERVQRYCSGSEAIERRERERVTYMVTAVDCWYAVHV